MKVFAVILAAGKSERFGSDKLWIDCDGQPLWARSLRSFSDHPGVDAVGIVCQIGRKTDFQDLAPSAAFVVEGGSTRQQSSLIGLQSVPADFDCVLIHDAARAFVSPKVIDRVIDGVIQVGAAFPAVAVTDTIKSGSGTDWTTLNRSQLVAVQTPQGALREVLLNAHAHSTSESTDEASLIEAMGHPILAVEGDRTNIKVTHPSDLNTKIQSAETRVGFGYDIHAYSTDPTRPMKLGGLEFDDRPGLEGHSDADVLIHAIVDSLLGAAGLADIGHFYPNTDPQWKDAPSSVFLSDTAERLRAMGWEIVNIDATLIGERPKINPRREEICGQLAAIAGLEPDRVAVKATTNEGLGSLGRGEGLAAQAVATIRRK